MARHIFIVSRLSPDLFDDLVSRFAEDQDVQVILDRRREERRRRLSVMDVERRGADRRRRPEIDAELRERSYAVVTIDGETRRPTSNGSPPTASTSGH